MKGISLKIPEDKVTQREVKDTWKGNNAYSQNKEEERKLNFQGRRPQQGQEEMLYGEREQRDGMRFERNFATENSHETFDERRKQGNGDVERRVQEIYANDERKFFNAPDQLQFDIAKSVSPVSQYAQAKQMENDTRVKMELGNSFEKQSQNQLTIDQMHYRLNGIDPSNPFKIFLPEKEFLIQNEVRTVDMNLEERILMNVQMSDVDDLRVVSRIPIGTELYRFKMEQYKELSTTRSEMEKLVQEQRLQRLRRNFEKKRRDQDRKFDNDKWADDQRKFIIAARLRKDFQMIKEVGEEYTEAGGRFYDPNEGLILHWDYNLGLPKISTVSQMVFGIFCNRVTQFSPKLVDPQNCEVQTRSKMRCIFGLSHHIFDIPAHPDTLLIWEVQLPKSKEGKDNEGFGWTQLDLFDVQRNLKRGKWKCPLYKGITNTNITIPQIQELDPIQGAWTYLRVSYPDDPEFGIVRSFIPEVTMNDYNLPTIHLRAKEKLDAMGEEEEEEEETIIRRQYGEEDSFMSVTDMSVQTDYEDEIVSYLPKEGPPGRKKRVYVEPPHKREMISEDGSSNLKSKGIDDSKNFGLLVTIVQVKNHISKSHLRVVCRLLEENSLVIDDNSNPCTFNTSIHNPLDISPDGKFKLAANQILSLQMNKNLDLKLENKAQNMNIRFQEDFLYLRNLKRMYKRNKKDIYLSFQVIEKPDPTQTHGDIKLKYGQSENANYGSMEYELLGWNLFKVNDNEGNVKNGNFTIKLWAPPLVQPPFDPSKFTITEVEFQFLLKSVEYDEDMLGQALGDKPVKKKWKKMRILKKKI